MTASRRPAPVPRADPMDPTARQLSGVLERIIYLNEENQYLIGELSPESGGPPVIISGTLPNVQCGETLELEGVWSRHPQHGSQFKFTQFRSKLPATVHGIRKFLGSGLVHGVGKVYANKIVDAFGLDTFRVISEESARLREVEGIGPKRVREIKAAWDEMKVLRDVMVFLQTYGVPVHQCLRLVKQYGSQAEAVLKTEPYRVAREVQGIGFKTADRIAINLGFANDAPPRLDAGLLYALQHLEDEGHTGYPLDALITFAAELLQADVPRLQARLQALTNGRELVCLPGSPLLQLPATERAETRLAQSIHRLSRGYSSLPPIKIEAAVAWAQEQAGFTFADEQAEAVRRALSEKVSILTGGPGTGKTTILRALVAILKAKKARVLLASPTGRAAQRMAEAAHHPAQTLHRLLKFDPAKGGFTANEQSPLAADCVVVDEASMLDTWLASALVRAVPTGAHLVLVGDVHQLPSVGPGNVLRDLIESRAVPVTQLQRIFRQREESSIVGVAHGILGGDHRPPCLRESIAVLDARHDLHFVRADTPDACREAVRALCAEFIPAHYRTLDPVMDVQVLAPMHRGTAGIGSLNQMLQQALNPQDKAVGFGHALFHVGDKVIQTRNNYDLGLFNGDLGRVTAINPAAGTLAAEFDGQLVEFDRADLGDLQPAFAISIHKSQGSEFPIVVIPLLKQHFMLLQRNLVYTAITRGRRKVFLVGDPAAYAMAVRNAESGARLTDLARKLQG